MHKGSTSQAGISLCEGLQRCTIKQQFCANLFHCAESESVFINIFPTCNVELGDLNSCQSSHNNKGLETASFTATESLQPCPALYVSAGAVLASELFQVSYFRFSQFGTC